VLLGIALSADGRKAALAGVRGVLHAWEPATGKELCRIADPLVGKDQADSSLDGKAVVVKHQDDVLRVWDAETGTLRCALPRFGNQRPLGPFYPLTCATPMRPSTPSAYQTLPSLPWTTEPSPAMNPRYWLAKTVPWGFTPRR
jgi:hypothetical protein